MISESSHHEDGKGVLPRVLVISSGGGHWAQLMRMRMAWEECETAYATTDASYRHQIPESSVRRFHVFMEANRWQRWRLVRQLLQVILIIFRERPEVVVTTGASAGYFAIRIGRLFGARTIWIDSIANVESLSLAGKKAGKYADFWLTQWPHLQVVPEGSESDRTPQYLGSVL